jgi:hypothetical protein
MPPPYFFIAALSCNHYGKMINSYPRRNENTAALAGFLEKRENKKMIRQNVIVLVLGGEKC